jgi:hypothetical protein
VLPSVLGHCDVDGVGHLPLEHHLVVEENRRKRSSVCVFFFGGGQSNKS